MIVMGYGVPCAHAIAESTFIAATAINNDPLFFIFARTLTLDSMVAGLGGDTQMQNRLRGAMFGSVKAALIAVLWMGLVPAVSQAQTYKVPRTADGKPDLNGIWEALNTANWDIQDHAARAGSVVSLGAAFSVPAGRGVVEG